VLRALDDQSLSKDRWELIVVDSASDDLVSDAHDLSWHPRGRCVRVAIAGLMVARLRGIAESAGELIVFVDDDNLLAPDYLEQALVVQERHQYLSVFGSGNLTPEFEIEPPAYLRPHLRKLSLRTVPAPSWSNNPEDHYSLPWGAGLCVRRSAVEAFVDLVERLDITSLVGRNGRQLYSGDDDLFAWAAASAQRGFGIFPDLRVTHLIPATRLSKTYMLRLCEDHRFSSSVRMYRMAGRPSRRLAWRRSTRFVLHGLRNGSFALRCRWAEMRGEEKAARFIQREGLRPIGMEQAPSGCGPQLRAERPVRLSVVMAVRNGEPYIAEAIESVLGQSFPEFEFLIVDDASTDTTREIVSSYERRDRRIRLIRNEQNLGPYPSTNQALRQARGEFVARHDADDVSPPDRFAIQLAALRDPRVALVTGVVEAFDSGGTRYFIRPPRWQPWLEWELLFSNAIGAGAHVMFPKVLDGRPVLFPAARRYAEDYGLWCALTRRGRVVCPPQVVYRYRQHETSITRSHGTEQEAHFAEQRHEHQSLHLGPGLTASDAADLGQFWGACGRLSCTADLNYVETRLVELRTAFLEYVERRFGPDDRDALDREVENATISRLAHWLIAATRRKDGQQCRELIAVAGRMGVRGPVASQVMARIARSATRKLLRTRARAGP
jgi:glycosyltransferase involved in cell wall biosynthesis